MLVEETATAAIACSEVDEQILEPSFSPQTVTPLMKVVDEGQDSKLKMNLNETTQKMWCTFSTDTIHNNQE